MESQLPLGCQTPEAYTVTIALQALQRAVEDVDRRIRQDETAILGNLRVVLAGFAKAETAQALALLQQVAWNSQWPMGVIGSIYREICLREGQQGSTWLRRWQTRFPGQSGLELLLYSWPESHEASDALAAKVAVLPLALWEFVSENQHLVGRFRA